MNGILYFIIILFFLIGGISIHFINLKKGIINRKENWIKYLGYFIIINALFIAININGKAFCYVSVLIVIAGCIELINLQLKQKGLGIFSFLLVFLIYGIYSILFLFFAQSKKEVLLFTLFIVCFFDSFSQISGQLFGKKKITPRLSPNKTYEGFFGGIFVSLIMSTFIGFLLKFPVLYSLILAFVICIAAFIGDLSASWIKRQYHTKDFSRIIPGHGGFLDRFDSFIVAGTIVYIFNLVFEI